MCQYSARSVFPLQPQISYYLMMRHVNIDEANPQLNLLLQAPFGFRIAAGILSKAAIALPTFCSIPCISIALILEAYLAITSSLRSNLLFPMRLVKSVRRI